uniref:J domain-containing protein n=1 Tax=Alexandrium monilatum TaxID=311494 RepID=A0A7S4QF28_9DINO
MAACGSLADSLQEACVMCGTIGCCLHVRKHGDCGPHAVCPACSHRAMLPGAPRGRAGGQLACPRCGRRLGTRRRALAEGLLGPFLLEAQLAVRRAAPRSSSRAGGGDARGAAAGEPRGAGAQEVCSLYAELGVDSAATDDQLERAYRRRARHVHPDKPGGSKEAFQRLFQAYERLLDPEGRAAHDRELAASGGGAREDGGREPGAADRRGASRADAEAALLARAAALRAVLGDCEPESWGPRLAALPRNAHWSWAVLAELASGRRVSSAKRVTEDRSLVHGRADVAETGLRTRFQSGGWRYEVRVVMKGITITTGDIRNCDAAIAAHGTLVRLLRSALRLIDEDGRSLDEAAKVFECPPVLIRFSFRGRRARGSRTCITPMTTDLSLVLRHRRRALSLLETAQSGRVVERAVAAMRRELDETRERSRAARETVAKVARRVLDAWATTQRPTRRLRVKQPLVPRLAAVAATQRPTRRLRGKQPLVQRLAAVPAPAAAAAAPLQLEDAPPAKRRRLLLVRGMQVSPAAAACGAPAPPPPPGPDQPATRCGPSGGSAMLALPPSSAPSLLALQVASRVVDLLDDGGSARPNIAMPWFQGFCRAMRLDRHKQAVLLRRMQESQAVTNCLKAAFWRAAGGD